MAVTFKDINQLTQKSSVAGTEKLPVSDTEYITPAQIVGGCLPLTGGTMLNTNLVTNLNADLLDGRDSSLFLLYKENPTGTEHNIFGYAYSGNYPTWHVGGPCLTFGYQPNTHVKRLQGTSSSNDLYLSTINGSGVASSWREFAFTDSNVASATSADLLDGLHASSFPQIMFKRSDTDSIYGLRHNIGIYDKGDYQGQYASEYPTNYGVYMSIVDRDRSSGAILYLDTPTNNSLGHLYVQTRGAGDSNTQFSQIGTVAYLTDNVASATKLETARTIWGQSFDGTGNVDGNITVGGSASITGTLRNCEPEDPGSGKVHTKLLSYSPSPFGVLLRGHSTGVHSIQVQRESNDAETFGLSLQPLGGNIGIGTLSPSYKLDVNGDARATSFIKTGGTSSQFLKADGSVDSNTYATTTDLANAVGNIETLLAAI